MNVASFELCKELHELSGWNKTQNVWAITNGEENKDILPWLRVGIGSSGAWEELPAYDLGYLLRKLPVPAYIYSVSEVSKQFIADMVHNHKIIRECADTPEDATAKLLIKLLEEGIITP